MQCSSCSHELTGDDRLCERCAAATNESRPVHGRFVGQVAGLAHRVEWFWLLQRQVWDFRLLLEDGSGSIGRAIPVQIVGMTLEGAIRDGDRVDVPGRLREGKTLRPRWVYNLTTQSLVRRRRWAGFATLPVTLLLLLTLSPLLWVGAAVTAGGGLDSALRSSRHAVLETLRTHDPCERLPLEISDARFEMRDRLEKYRDIDHALGIQRRIAQWEQELLSCPVYQEPEWHCDALAHQIKDLVEIENRWQLPSHVDQSPTLRRYYDLRRQWLQGEIGTLTSNLDSCTHLIAQR
jgi:hypothetical protein